MCFFARIFEYTIVKWGQKEFGLWVQFNMLCGVGKDYEMPMTFFIKTPIVIKK